MKPREVGDGALEARVLAARDHGGVEPVALQRGADVREAAL